MLAEKCSSLAWLYNVPEHKERIFLKIHIICYNFRIFKMLRLIIYNVVKKLIPYTQNRIANCFKSIIYIEYGQSRIHAPINIRTSLFIFPEADRHKYVGRYTAFITILVQNQLFWKKTLRKHASFRIVYFHCLLKNNTL